MAAEQPGSQLDLMAPSPKSSIEEIFQSPNLNQSKCVLYGEVLWKMSENKFMIADATGYCYVKAEDTSKSCLIKEDHVLKIENPKICKEESTIIITKNTTIRCSMDIMFKVQIKYCRGCNEMKKPTALLRHISHAKKCRAFYGEEKLKDMIENNTFLNKEKNYLKHKDKYNAKRVAKLRAEVQSRREKSGENVIRKVGRPSTTAKANKTIEVKDDDRYCPFCINQKFVNKSFLEKHIQSKHMHKCIGCEVEFEENSFYKHVAHTPRCKDEYGDEWEKMLNAKKNHVRKKIEIKRKPKKRKYDKSSL